MLESRFCWIPARSLLFWFGWVDGCVVGRNQYIRLSSVQFQLNLPVRTELGKSYICMIWWDWALALRARSKEWRHLFDAIISLLSKGIAEDRSEILVLIRVECSVNIIPDGKSGSKEQALFWECKWNEWTWDLPVYIRGAFKIKIKSAKFGKISQPNAKSPPE